jgi:hypothetical protein
VAARRRGGVVKLCCAIRVIALCDNGCAVAGTGVCSRDPLTGDPAAGPYGGSLDWITQGGHAMAAVAAGVERVGIAGGADPIAVLDTRATPVCGAQPMARRLIRPSATVKL